MTQRASGKFEVKISPVASEGESSGDTISRLLLDKRFHGDLDATSAGQMLGAMTAVEGSAGYVAMERVSGKLNGHSGSFTLQHMGTMMRGEPALTVAIVPDSGGGDLEGIAGTMAIEITDGSHFYTLEYTLPSQQP
ncbi:MAG TPA: DUF3224 domain-containing protein [Gammaproteobacteria bacterium]